MKLWMGTRHRIPEGHKTHTERAPTTGPALRPPHVHAILRILVEANELREPGMEFTRGDSSDLTLMRALARLLDQTRSGPR